MNYKKIYEQLIKRRKITPIEGYKERHHIIPKCMGGVNNKTNLVSLTAREHYIAHALLCKIYPQNKGLWYAFHCMIDGWINNRQQRNYKVSSRIYEWGKINYAKVVSDMNSGKTPWNKGLKGVCSQWNEEQRKEISRRNSGSGNGMYGRKQSDKCKEINSKIHKGRKYPPEIRFKNKKKGKDHPRYGKHWGPEYGQQFILTKCYKQLQRYMSTKINPNDWDSYKTGVKGQSVGMQTIITRFNSFENMLMLVNQKYGTNFVLV